MQDQVWLIFDSQVCYFLEAVDTAADLVVALGDVVCGTAVLGLVLSGFERPEAVACEVVVPACVTLGLVATAL